MAGHITKRDGKYRARYPDKLRGGTYQVERKFKTEAEAETWRRAMDESAHNGMYVNPNEGRTFAVVADEVRALAETSERSAKDVREIADNIQSEVRGVVQAVKAAADTAAAEAKSAAQVVVLLDALR